MNPSFRQNKTLRQTRGIEPWTSQRGFFVLNHFTGCGSDKNARHDWCLCLRASPFHLDADEEVVFYGDDLVCSFYLFALPAAWLPLMALIWLWISASLPSV